MLQPREADRVEAAIAKAGLTGCGAARRADSSCRAAQKAAYLAAVADAGALPANFDTLLDESLDSRPAGRPRDAQAARTRRPASGSCR